MSQTNRPFQFTGVSPYIDRAAKVLKLADPRLIGKARNIEHLARIQTALGQASQSSADDREAIFEQALAFQQSLAVALLAAQLAIVNTAEALGLDDPDYVDRNLNFSAIFPDQRNAP
jgi:hypothetical protein